MITKLENEKCQSNIEKYNQRRKTYKEQERDLEQMLVKEWLDKGNKIKVFTREFNNDDYKIGAVGEIKSDLYW